MPELSEQPLASLWLPKTKSSSAVTIYGRSGTRYMFKIDRERGNIPVRDYNDAAQFTKESIDIAENRLNTIPVAALVGVPDPIFFAKTATEALINASSKIGGADRLFHLNALKVRIESAMKDLTDAGISIPAGLTSETKQATPAPTPQPDDAPPVTAIPVEPILPDDVLEAGAAAINPPPSGDTYDQATLMTLPMSELRKLTTTKSTARKDLVDAILAQQTAV